MLVKIFCFVNSFFNLYRKDRERNLKIREKNEKKFCVYNKGDFKNFS